MISSITIESYRLFSRLEVPQLGHGNLIVGRNNAGKTAFLEAVRVLATNGSYSTIQSLVLGRLDAIGGSKLLKLGVDERLFNWNPQEPAVHVFANENRSVTVKFGFYRKASEDGGPGRLVPLDPHDEPRSGEPAYGGSTPTGMIRIRALGEAAAGTSFEPDTKCIHVGLRGFSHAEIGEIWPRVVLTPKEHQLNQFLGECFPEIERVAVSPLGSSTKVILKRKGSLAPVSIRSMGAGVGRGFGLALAAVSVAGDAMLVDEVESGLHYLVQSRFWRLLVAAAQEFKIQVFAATHIGRGAAVC